MDTQLSETLKKKNNLEDKIISYQVVRIEPFNKNSLGKIGAETERTAIHNRNEDIDTERTPLNLYYKKSNGGLNAQWKKTMKDLEIAFNETAITTENNSLKYLQSTKFYGRIQNTLKYLPTYQGRYLY